MPFISEQKNFSQINQAMDMLGGNYQLRTTRLPFFSNNTANMAASTENKQQLNKTLYLLRGH